MRGERIRRVEGSHRYGLVLVVIIVPIAFSLAAPDARWSKVTSVVLFAVAIVVSLAVAQARRSVQIVAFVLLVLACISAAVDAIVQNDPSLGVTRVILGVMIALAPFTLARGVLRHLRTSGRVTLDAVWGALAIYLMIGAFFATIDGAVGALGSTPFFTQVAHASYQEYLYFSYVTLATVGYGDFTPAHPLARTMAITEALSGQLYLVTIVALLVSNIGRATGGGGRGGRLSEEDDPRAN
jgi:voltage-gated potassium channel Kch